MLFSPQECHHSLLKQTIMASTAEQKIKSWREVHKLLSQAVLVAKEAVDAAKAQRRYWMEEICANLTTEGTLVSASVWKKPIAPKKVVKKRIFKTKNKLEERPSSSKDAVTKKSKAAPKRAAVKEERGPPKKKLKLKFTAPIRNPLPSPPEASVVASDDDTDHTEYDNDGDDNEDDDEGYQYHQPYARPAWMNPYHHPPPVFHHHSGYYPPAQMSYAIRHPPTTPSSTHDDMMNVPEELREFMGTTPRGNHNNTFVQHADDNTDEDDGDEEDDDDEQSSG